LAATIEGDKLKITFPELVAASMFITTDGNSATADFTLVK